MTITPSAVPFFGVFPERCPSGYSNVWAPFDVKIAATGASAITITSLSIVGLDTNRRQVTTDTQDATGFSRIFGTTQLSAGTEVTASDVRDCEPGTYSGGFLQWTVNGTNASGGAVSATGETQLQSR